MLKKRSLFASQLLVLFVTLLVVCNPVNATNKDILTIKYLCTGNLIKETDCINKIYAEAKKEASKNLEERKEIAATSATAIAILSILSLLFVGFILKRTKPNIVKNSNQDSNFRIIKWSLAKALSETYQVKKYNEITKREEVVETVLLASSSRTIAFLGLLVILTIYIGVGCVSIYEFALTGQFPENLDETVNFLFAGIAMFVPYGVNKLSGALKQPQQSQSLE